MSAGLIGWISRGLLAVGGIALAMPGNDMINMTNLELAIWAAVLISIGAGSAFLDRRQLIAARSD